ncbi:hypothetical protein FRB99_004549 [Tulasnella sp. 403]|nr:hypothetical protein FRB99_004549 [Tulasnella sp. 403]
MDEQRPVVYELPVEILSRIIALALKMHTRPANILCVHRKWLAVGQAMLNSDLVFTSLNGLLRFPYKAPTPRSITFMETVEDNRDGFWDGFRDVLNATKACKLDRLVIKAQLHYSNQNHYDDIYDVLKRLDPTEFEWHLRTDKGSVMPAYGQSQYWVHVTRRLALIFRSRWAELESVKLVNFDCTKASLFRAFDSSLHPRLSRIHIEQVGPVEVGEIVSAVSRLPNLEELVLTGIYRDKDKNMEITVSELADAFTNANREGTVSVAWDDVQHKIRFIDAV